MLKLKISMSNEVNRLSLTLEDLIGSVSKNS